MISDVDLLQKIYDYLFTSVQIVNYCTTEFSKRPTFYLGMDLKDRPDSTTIPAIVVHMVDRSESGEVHKAMKSIYISVHIKDDSETRITATTTDNGRIEYPGIKKVTKLREFVEAEILGRSNDIGGIIRADGETVTGKNLPLFASLTTINITFPPHNTGPRY